MTDPDSEPSGESRSLILGLVVAAVVIAVVVLALSMRGGGEPETTAKPKADAPIVRPTRPDELPVTGTPPPDGPTDDAPRPDDPDDPTGKPVKLEPGQVAPTPPPMVRVLAVAKVQDCPKAGACGAPKRVAARVSVRDRFGEVAGFESTLEAAARIEMPSGEYTLVAKLPDGAESVGVKVGGSELAATETGTVSVDLIIQRGPGAGK